MFPEFNKAKFNNIEAWRKVTIGMVKEQMIANNGFDPVVFSYQHSLKKIGYFPAKEMMDSGFSKDILADVIKWIIIKQKPDIVMLASEAWFKTERVETEVPITKEGREKLYREKYQNAKSLENDPEKKEVLMFQIETAVKSEVKAFEVKRDEIGKIISLEENNLFESIGVVGRFANLFPSQPKTHDN